MKSSYELAMERLNKNSPSAKLNDDQKKQLAELDSLYASKIAEREIFIKGELMKAREKGDFEAFESLEKQLTADRNNLRADLEEKKNKVREGK
ncbi:MAG TPA: hypothetical protein VM680_04865 [Verrucomicrobiae bacterium]|nr:hypothetical protein [Verrucomicrobiae bacterium]